MDSNDWNLLTKGFENLRNFPYSQRYFDELYQAISNVILGDKRSVFTQNLIYQVPNEQKGIFLKRRKKLSSENLIFYVFDRNDRDAKIVEGVFMTRKKFSFGADCLRSYGIVENSKIKKEAEF